MCIRDRDKGSKATNITHMPSYVAMCDLAVADKQVKRQLAKERASAAQDFAGEDLTPVSYTHLDVYKRQIKLRAASPSGYRQTQRRMTSMMRS